MNATGKMSAGVPAETAGCRPIGAAPHLGASIRRQLVALSRRYAPIGIAAGQIKNVYEILTQDSLDRPWVPPFAGLSFINADGLPFQWVFSFDSGRRDGALFAKRATRLVA